MMGCCYCEGCYLTPQQRKMENPRLGLHVSCFLELIREIQDIEAIRKFMAENSGDIQILKERLQNIDNFWQRMAKIDKFQKELEQRFQILKPNETENESEVKQP